MERILVVWWFDLWQQQFLWVSSLLHLPCLSLTRLLNHCTCRSELSTGWEHYLGFKHLWSPGRCTDAGAVNRPAHAHRHRCCPEAAVFSVPQLLSQESGSVFHTFIHSFQPGTDPGLCQDSKCPHKIILTCSHGSDCSWSPAAGFTHFYLLNAQSLWTPP